MFTIVGIPESTRKTRRRTQSITASRASSLLNIDNTWSVNKNYLNIINLIIIASRARSLLKTLHNMYCIIYVIWCKFDTDSKVEKNFPPTDTWNSKEANHWQYLKSFHEWPLYPCFFSKTTKTSLSCTCTWFQSRTIWIMGTSKYCDFPQ